MTKLKQCFSIFLLIFVMPIFFSTCSHKQSIDQKDAETEIWELHLTGEVVGKLKMSLMRIKIEDETYTITGKVSGRLKDYRAGTGIGDYKLKGKIDKEIFKANFSGSSNMEVGPSPTSGTLNGKVYRLKGSGKYSVLHAFGSSHGDYIMRKTNSN